MIPSFKTALIATACVLAGTSAMADASFYQITSKANAVINAKMNADAKSPAFSVAVGKFGVVDTALGSNDADYEAVLAARGFATGAAIYGQYDASYDAILTPANFFETAALGQHDAGYEPVLADRGMLVGKAVYGSYDADYEAPLFPQSGSCQTGEACF